MLRSPICLLVVATATAYKPDPEQLMAFRNPPGWNVGRKKRKLPEQDNFNPKEVYGYGDAKSKAKALDQKAKDNEEFKANNTPYGPIIRNYNAGSVDSPVIIEFAHPFALLWTVCQRSSHFFHWLQKLHRLKDKPWRVVFYGDEATPGNVHRPDKGRMFLGCYWSFLEYPGWFLTGECGWLPWSFVDHRTLAKIPGCLSHLAAVFIKVCFCNLDPSPTADCRFHTSGIRLAGSAGSASSADPRREEFFLLKAIFGAWIADAKAHKELTNCSGSSGILMCLECRNVVGRMSPDRARTVADLVHFTEADPSRFRRHTPESYRSIQEHLAKEKTRMNKTQFDEEQTSYGFKFVPGSLLQSSDPELIAMANLPDSVFWDWMHTLVSSGGIAQYELNQYLLRISKLKKEKKVKLSDIELYDKKMITWPKSTPAHKCNLTERLRRDPGDHIHMFASECLHWIQSISVFAKAKFENENILEEETRCFLLLNRIVGLLRRGDSAIQRLDKFEEMVLEHHRLFVKLYFNCAKPKTHYMLHISECFRRFLRNLSCFSPERLHKFTKHVAGFSYKNLTGTLLVRSLRHFILSAQHKHSVCPCHLVGPECAVPRRDSWYQMLASQGFASPDHKQAARLAINGAKPMSSCIEPLRAFQLKCPIGLLYSLDLVAWPSAASVGSAGGSASSAGRSAGSAGAAGYCVGWAVVFFECWGGDAYFVGAAALRSLGGIRYSILDPQQMLVPAEDILGAFPYIRGTEDDLVLIADTEFMLPPAAR